MPWSPKYIVFLLLVLPGCFAPFSASNSHSILEQGPGENGVGYAGFSTIYYERSSLTSGKCQLENGAYYDEEIDEDANGNFSQKADCHSDQQIPIDSTRFFQSSSDSNHLAYLSSDQNGATSSGIFEASAIVTGAALTAVWCIAVPPSVQSQLGFVNNDPSNPANRYTLSLTAGGSPPSGATGGYAFQVSWTSTLGQSDPLQSIVPGSFPAVAESNSFFPTNKLFSEVRLDSPYTKLQFYLNFESRVIDNGMGHVSWWAINVYGDSENPSIQYHDDSLCMVNPNYVP